MKNLIFISLITLSASVHACFEQASQVYEQEMRARRHDQIHVYPQGKTVLAGDQFETYGTIFSYDQDVVIFEGTSEFMSGFGVEAIVMNAKDCSFIEMVQVYAE